MPLSIQLNEKKPGFIEVVLDGRLDTDTSAELEKKLSGPLAGTVQAVRFDMSQLDYVSSMGIRVLFKTFKALRAKKAMFLMVNLQPQIKKVLDIAQALPPETVFSSVAEADEYFDAMQRKALGQEEDS
jgi:anti-sigma B factor antagonist